MTILGKHTIQETLDYIRAQDYRFDKDNEAYKSISAEWRNNNPTKAALLDGDWAAIYKKWKAACLRLCVSLGAQSAAIPLASANSIPAESEWLEANSYFVNGKEPGGMRDCEFRIEEAIGKRIDVSGGPLQNAPDIDVGAIKELDNSIKAGEAAAKATSEAAGKAAKSNMGLIIGGLVGAVVVTVVATKIYL